MAQLSLSALLISAATTAALNDNKSARLIDETHLELMRLTTVRPDAIVVQSNSSVASVYSNDKTLRLQVDTPNSLSVGDHHVHWEIRQDGKVLERLQGNSQGVDLPAGSYQVQLRVGEYVCEKQITIQDGQQIQPYFDVAFSQLKLRSNEVVDWVITGSDKRTYRINAKSHLSLLLPADNYKVNISLRDFTVRKELYVAAGELLEAKVEVPLGNVRLIATQDNQPMFKPVVWDIYRLEGKKRRLTGQYRSHSKSIRIPPGYYEAVAYHDNTKSQRQFLVRQNSKNEVVLALE